MPAGSSAVRIDLHAPGKSNISRRRDMLYGTQRGGQMRHFRKDLKTATRLGAVLDPFKSIIYTSIRARARRFIFFYF